MVIEFLGNEITCFPVESPHMSIVINPDGVSHELRRPAAYCRNSGVLVECNILTTPSWKSIEYACQAIFCVIAPLGFAAEFQCRERTFIHERSAATIFLHHAIY